MRSSSMAPSVGRKPVVIAPICTGSGSWRTARGLVFGLLDVPRQWSEASSPSMKIAMAVRPPSSSFHCTATWCHAPARQPRIDAATERFSYREFERMQWSDPPLSWEMVKESRLDR